MTKAEDPSKRLWLDDVRRPPNDQWIWVKSVDEAIQILEAGNVFEASLDNDLHPFEHDGLEVVEWMIEKRVFPRFVRVHTDNRFASTKMCGLLERCGYKKAPGRPRGFVLDGRPRISPSEFMRRNLGSSPNANEKLR